MIMMICFVFVCLLFVISLGVSVVIVELFKVGDLLFQLFGKDCQGEFVDLVVYCGKVVIVIFWVFWCGLCCKELLVFGQLQDIVGIDVLQVFVVNVKELCVDFFVIVCGCKLLLLIWIYDSCGLVFDQYGIEVLLYMFIFDYDGCVVYVYWGYFEQVLLKIFEEIIVLLFDEVCNCWVGG